MEIVAIVVLVVAALASPAVVLVMARKHSPMRAFIIGALTTFGITVLVGLAVIVAELLSGDFFDIDEGSCDEFCAPGELFELAVIVLLMSAVPIAVVGGFISALASLVLVRPKDSA